MKKLLIPQFIVVFFTLLIMCSIIYYQFEFTAALLFLIISSALIGLAIHGGIQYGKTEASSNKKDLLHD